MRKAAVGMHFPQKFLRAVLVASRQGTPLFATHQADKVEAEVGVCVKPVRLDSDVSSIQTAAPHICVAATIHRAFPGNTQILLVQPTARLLEGGSEFLG